MDHDDVGEDAALPHVELAGLLIVNEAADDVRGEQIRGELLAVERAAERLCEELGGGRLGKARVALDKDMASGMEADKHRFDELVFTDNRAVKLLFYAPRDYR